MLFYESITGQYFESNIQVIEDVITKLNLNRREDPWSFTLLNEWLSLIGLPEHLVGQVIGWEPYYIMGDVDITYITYKHDGKYVTRIEYKKMPRYP